MSRAYLPPPGEDENEPLLHDQTAAQNDRSQSSRFSAAQQRASTLISETNFYLKLGSTMFDFFVSGMAMAAVGVLIPDLERENKLKDDSVGLIFPAGVVGYLLATAFAQPLTLRIGLVCIAILSPVVRLLAAGVLCMKLPFGATLAAYCCLGFGTGLTDTAWNAWASRMPRPNVIQGFLHGSFAVGCVVSPPVADLMVRRRDWHAFYYIFVILSILELGLQGWAFRHDIALKPDSRRRDGLRSARRSIFSSSTIWLCAAFYLFYQGVEASLTDWIVVFMQRSRHTDSTTASTASSIFWVGMAVGRYALGPLTEKLGLRSAVTAYITLAIALQVALVFTNKPSVFLLLLGAIGFFIATVFPSGIILLVTQLGVPLEEQTGLVALAIGAGQFGAAVAPLGVGFLSARLGIGRLLDVVLVLSAVMLVMWAGFSRVPTTVIKDNNEDEEFTGD